jgi:hypothetical protein
MTVVFYLGPFIIEMAASSAHFSDDISDLDEEGVREEALEHLRSHNIDLGYANSIMRLSLRTVDELSRYVGATTTIEDWLLDKLSIKLRCEKLDDNARDITAIKLRDVFDCAPAGSLERLVLGSLVVINEGHPSLSCINFLPSQLS